MPDLEDIIQRVLVQGQDEVVDAFKTIGEAGEKGLEKLSQLAEGSAFAGIAEGLAGIVGVVTLVVGAFTALAKSSAETIVELSHLSEASGDTVEHISGVVQALARGGANTEGLQLAFKRLANSVATDWPAIEKEISSSADTMAGAQLKVAEASNNLGKAQQALATNSSKASREFINSLLGIAQADLTARQAHDALNVALGGTPDKFLAIEQAELSATKATQAAADARSAAADKQAAQVQQQKDDLLALKKSQLDLSNSQRAASEAALKDLPTIIAGIKSITDGSHNAASGFDIAKVAVVDLAKGIIASTAKGDIVDGFVKPTSIAVLRTVSDVFKNVEDASTKTALAIKLFGRGVDQELIKALSDGSKATEDYVHTLEHLNLTITDTEEHIAEGLHKSINQLSSDLGTVSAKFGIAFGPTVKQLIDDLDAALRKLSGDGTLKAFADGAANVFDTFTRGIRFVIDIITTIGNGIRNTFGEGTLNFLKNFSIAFGLIGAAVLLVSAPFIGLPLLIAAVIISIGEISKAWDKYKGDALAALDKVTKFFSDSWNSVKDFFAGILQDIGNSFQNSFLKKIIDGIGQAIEAVKKLATALLGLKTSQPTGSDAAAAGLSGNPEGLQFAEGGQVNGKPGRDTNLAWLSDGEFVMKDGAVSHYGAAFMHAINNLNFPRFASGGLNGNIARQAMSAGGPSGRPVILQFPGGQSFGLTGNDETITNLSRFAIASQFSSTGKKPGWLK